MFLALDLSFSLLIINYDSDHHITPLSQTVNSTIMLKASFEFTPPLPTSSALWRKMKNNKPLIHSICLDFHRALANWRTWKQIFLLTAILSNFAVCLQLCDAYTSFNNSLFHSGLFGIMPIDLRAFI